MGTLDKDVGGFPVSKFPFKSVFDPFCVPGLQPKGMCVILFPSFDPFSVIKKISF